MEDVLLCTFTHGIECNILMYGIKYFNVIEKVKYVIAAEDITNSQW